MPSLKSQSHPFSVHLANSKDGTDRFIWLINQKGGPRRFSGSSFATFEEARVAVKTKLASLVIEWLAAQNVNKLKTAEFCAL
ncbi:hypothetical protein [Methylobacterium sp. Leaf113]|uniref:hypothetical protein n=1 Tax=Methylobacterium sp. Leaf113 TaxID=1736259 RepID=UPI000AB272A7|nr:hypothetical protein [Methylobacterium sp. Leaf113]